MFPKRGWRMEKKYDLRILRTFKLLTDAFIQLMTEKHFEDITVNELCERAMIRRTTFYKHFADKYEFFRFFVRQLQSDFDTANPASAEYQNPQIFLMSIAGHVLEFLKENEQFVHMVFSSNMLSTLLDILSEQINFDITEKIKAGVKKGLDVAAAPEIEAAFFTGAIIYTIRWWYVYKKQISEEKLIEGFEKIIFNWS